MALAVGILTLLEILVFLALHAFMPDKVPFNYTVVLGAAVGGFVAVANFYMMGVTVQKVTSQEDKELAAKIMSASYSRRMLFQMLWVVIAIVAPCFQFVAGIVPLLFPGLYLKGRGILGSMRG